MKVFFSLLAIIMVSCAGDAVDDETVHLLPDASHGHHERLLSAPDSRHYLVTFRRSRLGASQPILQRCFNATHNHTHFIPNSAFIVYTKFVAQTENCLREALRDEVRSFRPLRPHEKFDTRVNRKEDYETMPPAVSVEFVAVVEDMETVRSAVCREEEHSDRRCAAVHARRLSIATQGARAYSLLIDLALHPDVLWVSHNRDITLFNEVAQWITQSNVVDSRPIWDKGIKGKAEIVAVGDTGLDVESCYFTDKEAVSYYPGRSATHRKIVSYVPSDCECTERGAIKAGAPATSGDKTDVKNGHGTHVSGSVAGSSASKRYQGMAPEARLVFMDLQDPTLSTASLRALYAGYKLDEKYYPRAYGLGARIHTNSWGTNAALGTEVDGVNGLGVSKPTSYDLYCVDTDTYAWNNKDYLILFAAGNDGSRGARTVAMPANSKNVLTVGALWKSENALDRGDVAFFSSTGPTFDKRVKPEVVAPGNDIWSASSEGTGLPRNDATCEAVEKQSGTSMATPITAGSIALLRQYLREGWHVSGVSNPSVGIPSPPASLLKALVIASAIRQNGYKKKGYNDPIGKQLNLTFPSYDNGFGAIQMDNVMLFNKPPASSRTKDVWFSYDAIITNKTKSFSWCFAVGAAPTVLKVVLTWTDFPASLQASKALVTNLDLLVYNDAGESKRGNQDLFPSFTFDDVNNVEVVEFQAPTVGNYRVYVVIAGDLLPAIMGTGHGGQEFSLAVVGNIGPVTETDNCPQQTCPTACLGNGICKKSAKAGRECQCTTATNSHIDCSAVCTPSSQCSLHGCLNVTCSCYQDSHRGFWSGSSCATCDSDHVGSQCTVARDCGGKGTLKGSACVCHASEDQGYWGGASCQDCLAGWSGVSCRCSSSDCNGHGVCGAFGCTCNDDATNGHWTQASGPTCAVCQPPWFGPKCLCGASNCSSHGKCTPDGCVCTDNDVHGHYRLDAVLATCQSCKVGWTGSACLCKVESGVVCGGHGECAAAGGCSCSAVPASGWWRNTSVGACDICAPFAFGPSCRCLSADCSGHGTCTANGCVCDGDALKGYWDVTASTCKKCQAGWYGAGCLCSSSSCDGHGVCGPNGCQCYKNATHPDPALRGFFEGTATCAVCAAGWTPYPLCLCASPNCNGHGECTSDRGCVCHNDAVRGHWKSGLGTTDCVSCLDGFYGPECTCGHDNCFKFSSPTAKTNISIVNKIAFEDGTSFELRVGTGTAAAGTLKPYELTFVMVKIEDTDHPNKATPGGLRFVGTTFRWKTEDPTQGISLVNSTATYTFDPPLILTITPSVALSSGIVKSSIIVMYLHPRDGWQNVKKTCAQPEGGFDPGMFRVTAKICGMVAGGTLFAIYGEVEVADFTEYFIIGGTVGGFVLLLSIFLLVIRFRRIIAEERKQKEAKELVLRFMTQHKNDVKPLRVLMGLRPGENFTPQFAAGRLVSALMKRRAIVDRLLQQPRYKRVLELSRALDQQGVVPETAEEATDALATLSQHPVKALWEFREHEMLTWEACRRVRGMFTRDPFSKEFVLQPGAMDETRQKIVEVTAENSKLRRMLQAERYKQLKDNV